MVYENKDCVVLNGHCRLYSEILIFFQVIISQLLCIEMITVPEYNLKSILYIYIHTIDFIHDAIRQRSLL